MTVTVQIPDGIVLASSVTEITITKTDDFYVPHEARGVRSKIRGEAVVLEVMPNRYLFVLLDGVDQLALRSFPQLTYTKSNAFGQWARSVQKHRNIGEVPREYYPMMVTFGTSMIRAVFAKPCQMNSPPNLD